MSAVVPASPAALKALEVAAGYARSSMSGATQRAYKADWQHFLTWCERVWVAPLPADPAHVGAYIASMALTHKPTTIKRRLSAIAAMHRLHGHDWSASDAAIRQTLKGLLREHGRPVKKAQAIGTEAIRALVATCQDGLYGLRDRALLLLGFSGAFRRAELVALYIDDCVLERDGLRILIRRAKGDRAGQGAEIGIPWGAHPETCPVRAWQAWRAVLPPRNGPLFRRISLGGRIGPKALRPCAVWDILERRARAADLPKGLTPHGLRAGFITEAYNAGGRDDDIMAHSRHRDLKTFRGYIRRARTLTASPAGLVGL
jgi:integrase